MAACSFLCGRSDLDYTAMEKALDDLFTELSFIFYGICIIIADKRIVG